MGHFNVAFKCPTFLGKRETNVLLGGEMCSPVARGTDLVFEKMSNREMGLMNQSQQMRRLFPESPGSVRNRVLFGKHCL